MFSEQHYVVPAGNSQAVAAANATAVNTCVAKAIASAAASANASNGEQASVSLCMSLLGQLQLATTHQSQTEPCVPREDYVQAHHEWDMRPLCLSMPDSQLACKSSSGWPLTPAQLFSQSGCARPGTKPLQACRDKPRVGWPAGLFFFVDRPVRKP